MAERGRWRLAKRVFTAVLADVLTVAAEPAELDDWAARNSHEAGPTRPAAP
jgi:hypothetical protein